MLLFGGIQLEKATNKVSLIQSLTNNNKLWARAPEVLMVKKQENQLFQTKRLKKIK